MKKATTKEWGRLLNRVRRHGPLETAKHVSELVRGGGYPLWYPHQFIDYLLRHGEMEAAEILLKTTRRFGEEHFLIDTLYARWLWSCGKRTAAIRFTERKAKFWLHSSLYQLLSAMHRLSGDDLKDKKYLTMAAVLAHEESACPEPFSIRAFRIRANARHDAQRTQKERKGVKA